MQMRKTLVRCIQECDWLLVVFFMMQYGLNVVFSIILDSLSVCFLNKFRKMLLNGLFSLSVCTQTNL